MSLTLPLGFINLFGLPMKLTQPPSSTGSGTTVFFQHCNKKELPIHMSRMSYLYEFQRRDTHNCGTAKKPNAMTGSNLEG